MALERPIAKAHNQHFLHKEQHMLDWNEYRKELAGDWVNLLN